MQTETKMKLQAAAAAVVEKYPSSPHALAEPPAGSDLKPVMGDFGAPGIGHTLAGLADPLRVARDRYSEFGPVSWSGSLGMRIVNLVGPEALQQVWSNRDKAFSSEEGWEPMIGPFFRRGVMLMDFDEHLHHRRILQQAFTRPRLVAYLDMMTSRIVATMDAWEPAPDFPVYTRSKEMLLAIATEVFVGAQLGPEASKLEHAFEDAVKGGQAIVRANMPGGTWSKGLKGRRVLQEYFRSELPARRAGDGDDLFSVLCHSESDDGHTFSDEDIVNHMIFAMMAAHDTSTLAVSMLTYYLGLNPEWQERLRAESLALGKPTLEYGDLDSLPSLDLAFKEALRLNAPVGMLFRKTVKDTDVMGHFIPEGTLVSINPYATMRIDDFWHDPDVFDPERFTPERAEDKSHRFAWAPFGGGAHKCIGLYFGGMTVKATMHQLLQRFEWSVPDDYVMPLVWGTGPTPADGLPITLRRRTTDRVTS
ncbi:cytochrome P450 [Williamsia soli]|uniref:cytochrome P450 n=1 Tax=Williamsia soli TaxID=364929 RepID=UPI001A9E21F1|nr:cytochrome P450 [Williamsia soli]